jgi:hypothetical protein
MGLGGWGGFACRGRDLNSQGRAQGVKEGMTRGNLAPVRWKYYKPAIKWVGVWGRCVLDGERRVKQGVCFLTAFLTRKDLCSAKGVGKGVTKVHSHPTLVHALI